MSLVEAALYLHVPFCLKKCPYCDFYSIPHVPSTLDEKAYLKALKAEVSQLKPFLFSLLDPDHLRFTTFYVGGGTPSLLSPGFYQSVFELLASVFNFSPEELTLEANPDTLTPDKLKGFLQAGFNRLSLGVQSLTAKGLKTLQRTHDLKTTLKALETASSLFKNLSLDFIFGWRHQGEKTLKKEIETALSFSPTHLSFYELTIEKNRPFSGFSPKKPVEKLYLVIEETLKTRGFLRYEISNYAKPGFECQHNLFYWEVKPYLGLGPSAVSRVSNLRWQNPADLKAYAENLLIKGKLPLKIIERLDNLEFAKEYLFMGLRLQKGIDLKRLKNEFGYTLKEDLLKNLSKKGLIEKRDHSLTLTFKGKLLHNQVVKLLWKALLKT
ncbi:radical SAM family heme chaperone HemW [Thermodesulfobacterium sp. TA1]|uniref:radical SAM family heme chaperone HemW n=1 Tax=Thermodesulfobacterium sp. TA1 TaxID=2234087 RepID=UPI0012328CA0|nr:radical SAM family heme chaperone HemW [Thermodesulfobacterium sp. TA1]QER42452.1 radical SAM family heme chaperone HemW [Thermodesulfobacterium sp. TA1]